MARVNVNILGIRELKWTGMGEFNSDDHYIYYWRQESLRRNGVTIMVNKRVWNAVLGCNLKKDRIISVRFQGCREPPREIAPMTRSCGRELLSKASELNGLPRLSRTSTPKPESVCFTISWLSPTPLTLTGGYSWSPFSGENQLRAIANKSPGHEKNISNQNPSVSIIACLAGISRPLQLCIWLFTSSQLWEAWKV